MKIVRYQVRVLDRKGNVTFKKTFKVESVALERARKAKENGKKVILRKKVKEGFKLRDGWGSTTTRPAAPKPVKTLVGHHSVTKQLSPNATVKQEQAEMRSVQAIGYARGLGGFPYGVAIPPSGRCYKGSGFGTVEAATGGYNTPTDSIVFLGNYEVFKLTKEQIEAAVAVGRWAREQGFTTKVVAFDPHQKYKATACPGKHVMAELKSIEKQINS
jgi:hypothetical protein